MEAAPKFIVLASSSSGNCAALVLHGPDGVTQTYLIDAGLSPRRTFAALRESGIGEGTLRGVIFTHLDSDHCHGGWAAALPDRATVYIHTRHRSRAERMGLLYGRACCFEREFRVGDAAASVELASHDQSGVAVFRFTFACGGTLGYATDLGRATERIITHLREVDVLAMESNYCPELQRASGRPLFLQRRITDGSGHLSNAQSAEAVGKIRPRRGVVLLHLSGQCNTRERALAAHSLHGHPCVVAEKDAATPWIGLRGDGRAEMSRRPVAVDGASPGLFA